MGQSTIGLGGFISKIQPLRSTLHTHTLVPVRVSHVQLRVLLSETGERMGHEGQTIMRSLSFCVVLSWGLNGASVTCPPLPPPPLFSIYPSLSLPTNIASRLASNCLIINFTSTNKWLSLPTRVVICMWSEQISKNFSVTNVQSFTIWVPWLSANIRSNTLLTVNADYTCIEIIHFQML